MLLRISLFLILMSVGIAHAEQDLAKKLEDHFTLYLIKSERRSQGDRVSINGNMGVLYYWASLKNRKPDEVICDAYEWLLLGRTTYGKGVQEAFDEFPTLEEIDLSFYDLSFSTKRGNRIAEILPDNQVVEYLRVGVRKSSFLTKKFDRKEVRKMIDDHQCVEVGKMFVDIVSINEDYMKAKK